MKLKELKDALNRYHGIYDDYEVELFVHDGALGNAPRGTWHDEPIQGIEVNDDVYPQRLRIVCAS